MAGRKPRLITPGEAKRSLLNRLSGVVDRAGQLEVRLGLRPYQCFLTWTKWTGLERGEGTQIIVCRQPILPTPVVADLTSLSRQPYGAGRYANGSVRVTAISVTYPADILMGRILPEKQEIEVPEPYEFFWEIVEDGRHECAPQRRRFSPASEPFLDAENVQWAIVLEKQSDDMGRDGNPVDDPVALIPSPWDTRKLTPPDDD